MKKSIYLAYVVIAVGLLLFLIYQNITFQNAIFKTRPESSYYQLMEYQRTVEEDSQSPIGMKSVFRFPMESISSVHTSLIFYTFHQNVKVYMEDELIYSLRPSDENKFGKTSGYVWHRIPIYPEDYGKEIQIEFLPSYKTSLDVIPNIYLGDAAFIWQNMVRKDSPSLIISSLAIFIGLLLTILSIYNYRNPDWDRSLLMLGIFAVNLGLWKLSETPVISLLMPDSIVNSSMPFIALLLLMIPFELFMKEQHQNKESNIWYIPCFVNILVCSIVMLLQMLDIADFRETIVFIHLALIFVAGITIVMMMWEVSVVGWTVKVKRNVFGIVICLIGMIVDFIRYYVFYGHVVMLTGMTLFVVYIAVIGVLLIQEAKGLVRIGKHAKVYEEMAYRDQLTGMLNRTAYASFVEREEFSPQNYTVVMFDLNDLKQCNDTYGHGVGDRYICDSARLIEEHFGNLGKCFRLGGDEFGALLPECLVEVSSERVQSLQRAVEEYNSKSNDIKMGIACGVECFDAEEDLDLGDTLRRADKKMYYHKIKMKSQNSFI